MENEITVEEKISYNGVDYHKKPYEPHFLYRPKSLKNIKGTGIKELSTYAKEKNYRILVDTKLEKDYDKIDENTFIINKDRYVKFYEKTNTPNTHSFFTKGVDIAVLTEIAKNQEKLQTIISNIEKLTDETIKTFLRNKDVIKYLSNKENEKELSLIFSQHPKLVANVIKDMDFNNSPQGELENLAKEVFNKIKTEDSFREVIEYALSKSITKQNIIDGYVLKERGKALEELEGLINKAILQKDKKESDDETILEKSFQDFLSKKENHWILGNALIYYLIPKDESNVEGQHFKTDIMRENLLGYYTIVELKTPKTDLLRGKAITGKVIYGASSSLTNAVQQVLFYKHRGVQGEIKEATEENSRKIASNSTSLVIIGHSLEYKDCHLKKQSFELYRNSIKDVIIITYDELLANAKEMLGKIKEEQK